MARSMVKKQTRQCLRVYIFVLVLLVAAGLGVWLWQQYRFYEHTALADSSWSVGGKPMQLDVYVTDGKGAPLKDVFVEVMNDSGGSGENTDAAGHALIQAGEPEFGGLEVNKVEIVSRPHGWLPYSTDVAAGLRVKIVIKDKMATGVK